MAENIQRKTSYVSDTTSMKIDVVGDSFINTNIEILGIKPVTNPQRFERGNIPTIDGLFSPDIFGVTPEEQRTTFGYIDLNCKVFHPYIYEILKRMWSKIDKIAAGQSSWKVNADGQVEEVPGGSNDNTGMDWLVKNFRKINFADTGSHIRDERVKLINSLKDDEIFISKWLVIPVWYRAIQNMGGQQNVPPINKMYTSILQYAISIKKDPTFANVAKYNMQNKLIEIRKFGQSLVEKKHGFFKKSVLGKSIDYGYRSVISVYAFDDYDTPEENPIDIYHSGIPLSQCCVLFYPFIKHYVEEFFRKEMDSLGGKYPLKHKDGTIEYIELDDPLGYYNSNEIQRIVDSFSHTPAVRFRPIMLRAVDGKEYPLVFTGMGQNNKEHGKFKSDISNRVMTWTDLLYMAAEEVTADKHVYITRYPIVDYFSCFPSRVHVLSTMKTDVMVVNGRVYKYYPRIDPSMPDEEVGTVFNDTVTMDNCYLAGLGGDYDGDQISIKGVFTQEANQEAEDIMFSIKHYVSINGTMMRTVGNEIFLTYYNMTKE